MIDADGRGIRRIRKGHARERTKAGLDSALQEGRIGGRRPKLTPQQQSEIRKMVSKGDKTAADATHHSKSTLPLSCGSWRGLTPKSVQNFTPVHLQSDRYSILDLADRTISLGGPKTL